MAVVKLTAIPVTKLPLQQRISLINVISAKPGLKWDLWRMQKGEFAVTRSICVTSLDKGGAGA